MIRSNIYRSCRIPGCATRGTERWLEGHEKALHHRCSCGWVGVGIGSHVGQMKRYGYTSQHVALYTLRSETIRDLLGGE